MGKIIAALLTFYFESVTSGSTVLLVENLHIRHIINYWWHSFAKVACKLINK